MQPHQERVVKEKEEIDEKIEKLANFVGANDVFASLDKMEQNRLVKQWDIMRQYSEILEDRIAAF